MSLTTSVEVKEAQRYVGKPILRKEAPLLLQGKGVFTDDVTLPVKVYHVAFVRSTYAHARIRAINVSRALTSPGVVAVFTGEDFKDFPMGYWMHHPGMAEPRRTPLAYSKVRYQGEPVAMVVAENQYQAEDAAELVDVEYDPLPALVDPLKSSESDVKIFEELKDNVLFRDSYTSSERVREVVDSAPVVIEEVLKNTRTSPVSLETRAAMAWYDGERLNIWASTQFPHVVRTYVAETLNFPENRIKVMVENVGGGFGPKSSVFGDEMAVYAAALKLKVPIKWVETRTEHMLITGHERDQYHFVKAGFTSDGRLLGLVDRIVADLGAGTAFWTEVQPVMVASVSVPGPYKFDNYSFEVLGVATNKAPVSPNIGFGRPVAAFVMERVMDIAARKLGLNVFDIRMRNLIDKEDFPYVSPAKVVYDSGDYKRGLELLRSMLDVQKLEEERKELRKKGKLLGVGISVYSEYTAPPSSRLSGVLGWEVGGYEKATVRVDPTGKVQVLLGVMDMGQGHRTVFAQIAADSLGVKMDDVYVVEGNTDVDPYGFGSWASRATVTAGNAVMLACEKLKRKILRIAAHLLNSKPENLTIAEGIVRDQNSGREIKLAEVAKISYRKVNLLPPGEEPELEESAVYEPPQDMTVVSYAWHGAVVEVDPETLEVKVDRYYVVHDSGKLVNPALAEAQVVGTVIGNGFLQTFNELVYDSDGNLRTTSFWDYVPPTAQDVPEIFEQEHLVSPSPTPGGFKGMGEGGAIGAPAALVNALDDALSEFGVKITKVPISWNELYALALRTGVPK
ncbi:xanthine dehydrogenase family protein molybdopterin-binding subunit [Sulfodiicoccus acidiphilus]|nr:xanthine dehydrogenase family protein molybdopterin-binding subunit [Sulfodiicoccus acidiphilus]